jgi:NADP-dependent 3-hydroxy acid dehydrogenase YdfG
MREKGLVVLVHDASIGEGNSCAAYLGKKGQRVYGAMAQPEYYKVKSDEYFKPIRFEPGVEGSAESLFEEVLNSEPRVDVLVLCPFRELSGALEDTGIQQFSDEIKFRFLSHAALLKKGIEAMGKAGGGKILAVIDAEAPYGIPYHGASAAGDAALEALVLSARLEASIKGVDLCVIEAAGLRTGLSVRRSAAQGWSTDSVYHDAAERATAERDRKSRFGADPVVLGRKVASLIGSGPLKPRYAVGSLAFRFPKWGLRIDASALIERGTMSYYGLLRAREGVKVRRRKA